MMMYIFDKIDDDDEGNGWEKKQVHKAMGRLKTNREE